MPEKLIEVPEARRLVLERVRPLAAEQVPLRAALGRSPHEFAMPVAVLEALGGMRIRRLTRSLEVDTAETTQVTGWKAAIPIEERKADEVAVIRGVRIAPVGTDVRNPAFDVTPAALIRSIVTEVGEVAPEVPAVRAALAL